MIIFQNISTEDPYRIFKKTYEKALTAGQKNIEAISISSYSKRLDEVNARFVNLKIVDGTEFIFFTNYNSPKSIEFSEHNQITALIYWRNINAQIRMKAVIEKKSTEYNSEYFSARNKEKNALAISSEQSKEISAYADVKKNFKKALRSSDLKKCPKYWGGFSFIPHYFEFWQGHKSRINKREAFILKEDNWQSSFLQP